MVYFLFVLTSESFKTYVLFLKGYKEDIRGGGEENNTSVLVSKILNFPKQKRLCQPPELRTEESILHAIQTHHTPKRKDIQFTEEKLKLLCQQHQVCRTQGYEHVALQFEAQISSCRNWPAFTERVGASICSSYWRGCLVLGFHMTVVVSRTVMYITMKLCKANI